MVCSIHIHTVIGQFLFQIGHELILCPEGNVHLIDKNDRRDMISCQTFPDRFCMGLHTILRIDQQDGQIKDLEAAFHFCRKVDMAGRIDHIDLASVPLKAGLFRIDRNAPLALLHVIIEHRVLMIDPACFFYFMAGIQHAFDACRFAGIDMR